ncbi:Cadherin-like [Trinorchestia longiramus]|nr:Cadherin-like [Trinorchestia longiramus]
MHHFHTNCGSRKTLTVPLVARTPQGTAAATLYVSVEDVNEFAPRFASDLQQTQITEEDDRHLPKPVIQVAARDRDGGRWGILQYSISGDGIPDSQVPLGSPSNEGFNKKKQNHPYSLSSSSLLSTSSPSFPPPLLEQLSSGNKSSSKPLSSLALKRFLPLDSTFTTSKSSPFTTHSSELSSSPNSKLFPLELRPSSQSFPSPSSPDTRISAAFPLESDALVLMQRPGSAFRGSSLAAPPTAVAPPSVSQSQYWRQRTTAFSIDPTNGTIYVLKAANFFEAIIERLVLQYDECLNRFEIVWCKKRDPALYRFWALSAVQYSAERWCRVLLLHAFSSPLLCRNAVIVFSNTDDHIHHPHDDHHHPENQRLHDKQTGWCIVDNAAYRPSDGHTQTDHRGSGPRTQVFPHRKRVRSPVDQAGGEE